MAVLLSAVVFVLRALTPKATFCVPVVFNFKVLYPTDVLLEAVLTFCESIPIAMFSPPV